VRPLIRDRPRGTSNPESVQQRQDRDTAEPHQLGRGHPGHQRPTGRDAGQRDHVAARRPEGSRGNARASDGLGPFASPEHGKRRADQAIRQQPRDRARLRSGPVEGLRRDLLGWELPCRACRYRLGVRTRGSQPRDRGSNPRTGTNLPSRKLSVTCSGFLGGVFASSEALFGGILKDS
jgi:hypothetical protein